MKDVQSQRDNRGISIDRVGIKNLEYPIDVLDKEHKFQTTVALVNMSVLLPHHFKGIHMSRFIEILNSHKKEITLFNIGKILSKMRSRLNADKARMELRFSYFMLKSSPKTLAKSLMNYNCAFIAEQSEDYEDKILEVRVPVTTLCPCSKEISTQGAHNQRSYVTISIRMKEMVWIEEIVQIAENAASAPIYPLLKRADEKFVTELAYDNPVFVEDLVRNVAENLLLDKRITWFKVEGESIESIHNHNAFACLERKKEDAF